MYVFHRRLLKFNRFYCGSEGVIKFHYSFSAETNLSVQGSALWFKDLSLESVCASFPSLRGCQVQFTSAEGFLWGLKPIKTVMN